jgi:integrase/recombinase XerD
LEGNTHALDRRLDEALSGQFDLGRWSQQETTSHIADALAHFLLSLRSQNTRRNYARDLREFFEFANSLGAQILDVNDVKEKLVLLWLAHLEQKHTRYAQARRRIIQTSVARQLCSLSSFLEFSKKRGLIEKNCLDNITRPKVKRESKTNALTSDEVKLILTSAALKAQELSPEMGRSYRSRGLRYVVISTLLSVGMRVEELCELRIADLEVCSDFTKLHMTAKGGETHSPIIHARTAQMLQKYIAEFRHDAKPGDYLFLRAQKVDKETKLTQPAIYEMLKEMALEAGITKKISPHSCRATLATLLHNKGVPIGQIQDLLNHKQITTTAIYIKKAEAVNEAAATKIDLLLD